MKTKTIQLAAILILLAITGHKAAAQFIKIDDFVNAVQGNLSGQTSDGPSNGIWHAVGSLSTIVITNSTSPGVGLPGSGTPVTTNAATATAVDGAAYIALPVAIASTSTLATVFMQFDMGTNVATNNVNWDLANVVSGDAGGANQMVELNANGPNRAGITIRNGGNFVELSADGHTVFTPLSNTVYNIWFVVNNAAKNFIIYMSNANTNATDIPSVTRMQIATTTGNTPTTFTTNAIGFRNTTGAALTEFVFGTGGTGNTSQYLYSLYEDPLSLNLTNPITGAAPSSLSPPVITSQPQPEQLFAGGSAAFAVGATGGSLHYQWLSNGVAMVDAGNVAGSGTSTLTITNVSAANAANYSCQITNNNTGTYTSTNSAAASLTIVSPNGAFETSLAAVNPLHFYAFEDAGNPGTGTEVAFDFTGGDNGIYGTDTANASSGNPGPRPSDGYPGFSSGNASAGFFAFAEPSHVTISSPWNINTNTVTITAWINPNGGQDDLEGIAFNRGSGSDVSGLNTAGSGNSTLGYTWNNDAGTINWDSGLQPPSGQWSFVALVVTPTNATIHMMNTNGLSSSTHVFNHANAAFGGTTMIGDDSGTTSGLRTFIGSIDDVAVFKQVLTQSQLQSIFTNASGVTAYAPFNTVALLTPSPIYPGMSAQFSAIVGGSTPLFYTWQVNGVNLTDGANSIGTIIGSATSALTISNLAVGDAGQSYNVTLVTSNSVTSYTSATPAVLNVAVPSGPQNIDTLGFEAAGTDWNTGTNWSDGNPASVSAFSEAGSTYHIVPGTLERTPASTNAVFPGAVMVIEGNGVLFDGGLSSFNTNTTTGELRLKQSGNAPATNFATAYADGGTISFPDLQLNGGQIDNGTSSKVTLIGRLDVLTNSSIYADSASAGAVRTIQINSFLTGPGTITYGYLTSGSVSNDLIISGTTNSFTGKWVVQQGTLLGNALNSLGTNSITVNSNGVLETSYNINDSGANLVLNGQMHLYTSDTFNGVTIAGVSLAAGTYSFAQLRSVYPANFPLTWPVQLGSVIGTNTGVGSITVLTTLGPQFTQQPTPASLSLYPGQTAQFSAIVSGALSYQWWFTNLSNVGAKLSDGVGISGSLSNVLTLSGVTAGQAGTYTLVASNSAGNVASSNAVLTILTPGPATTITMSVVETTGQDWDTAINWSDGNPASLSAYSEPGSTYVVLPGAALQTPTVASNTSFPGAHLVVSNTGALLLEHIGARSVGFADLLVDGGLIDNGADGLVTVTGQLHVANNVTLYTDTNSPPGLVVNFDVPGGVGGTNFAGPGALIDAGHTYWNPISQTGGTGTTAPATNSDGVTTSAITLTVNSGPYGEGNVYGQYGPYNNSAGSAANTPRALESDFLYIANTFVPNFAQNTITNILNNVSVGTYNLILYGNNGGGAGGVVGQQNDWGTTFTVSSDVTSATTLSTSNRTASYTSNAFILGADYVVFSNVVVDVGATITFTWTPNTNAFSPDYAGPNSQGAFNGLQLAAVVPPAAGPRPSRIDAVLSGGGTITYSAGDTNYLSDLNIANAGNTFSGQWNIAQGTLLGSATGSLGTNGITVGAQGALETAYNINDANAGLVLNGKMFLHQNDTFKTAAVNGAQLSPGTYSFAQLSSAFPPAFPASWPLQTGSAVNTGSGNLTVLSGPAAARPVTITGFTIIGGNLVLAGTNGAAFGTYRVLTTTNAAAALSSWIVVTNGSFDGGGNLNATVPFSTSTSQRYYSVVSP